MRTWRSLLLGGGGQLASSLHRLLLSYLQAIAISHRHLQQAPTRQLQAPSSPHRHLQSATALHRQLQAATTLQGDSLPCLQAAVTTSHRSVLRPVPALPPLLTPLRLSPCLRQVQVIFQLFSLSICCQCLKSCYINSCHEMSEV